MKGSGCALGNSLYSQCEDYSKSSLYPFSVHGGQAEFSREGFHIDGKDPMVVFDASIEKEMMVCGDEEKGGTPDGIKIVTETENERCAPVLRTSGRCMNSYMRLIDADYSVVNYGNADPKHIEHIRKKMAMQRGGPTYRYKDVGYEALNAHHYFAYSKYSLFPFSVNGVKSEYSLDGGIIGGEDPAAICDESNEKTIMGCEDIENLETPDEIKKYSENENEMCAPVLNSSGRGMDTSVRLIDEDYSGAHDSYADRKQIESIRKKMAMQRYDPTYRYKGVGRMSLSAHFYMP